MFFSFNILVLWWPTTTVPKLNEEGQDNGFSAPSWSTIVADSTGTAKLPWPSMVASIRWAIVVFTTLIATSYTVAATAAVTPVVLSVLSVVVKGPKPNVNTISMELSLSNVPLSGVTVQVGRGCPSLLESRERSSTSMLNSQAMPQWLINLLLIAHDPPLRIFPNDNVCNRSKCNKFELALPSTTISNPLSWVVIVGRSGTRDNRPWNSPSYSGCSSTTTVTSSPPPMIIAVSESWCWLWMSVMFSKLFLRPPIAGRLVLPGLVGLPGLACAWSSR